MASGRMTWRRIFLHVTIWAGIYTFWLLATRNHHPTWTIAALATAVLVAAFALAVYVNGLILERLARPCRWLQYALTLVATIIVLDLAAVFLIQFIYDRLWGPDPLRYGFWFNVLSDGALIIIHLAGALGVRWLAKHFHGRGRSS